LFSSFGFEGGTASNAENVDDSREKTSQMLIDREKEEYTRKEFDFSGASRTFRTSEKIDAENISARYENGVLTVQLPKKEAFVKPARMISVE